MVLMMYCNMKIDFFEPKCSTENIKAVEFGICDDVDKEEKAPAYIDYYNLNNWVAKISNKSGKSLNFIAIDNCIEIYRENGEMENRCDAMLVNADNIVFVELKDQMSGWINKAVIQLQITIDYFKKNNDMGKYRYKRAFACNKQHPHFQSSYKELMSAFYKKNKIRLNLQCNIVFK